MPFFKRAAFYKKEKIMLTEILSRETCAKCRICCTFDKYDIWETPVITKELKEKIEKDFSDVKFIEKGHSYLFRMENADENGIFYCPVLTEKGCALGDEKPFDCRIWPFRIMNFNGTRVISLSPVCESVFSLPVKKIRETAEKLSDTIFSYADKNPDIVKPYDESYPIIISERNSK